MNDPATKAQMLVEQYGMRLNDAANPMDELSLRRMLAECRQELAVAPDDEARATLWVLIGGGQLLLGKHRDALDALKNARRFSPGSVAAQFNIALVLQKLDLRQEALAELKKLLDFLPQKGTWTVQARGEQAEAFLRLGRVGEARAALNAALAAADWSDSMQSVRLALYSVDQGAEHDAIELLARYLAQTKGEALGERDAMDVVREWPEELVRLASLYRDLGPLVARVLGADAPTTPDSMALSAGVHLDEPQLAALEALSEHPPAPSEALRKLMRGDP